LLKKECVTRNLEDCNIVSYNSQVRSEQWLNRDGDGIVAVLKSDVAKFTNVRIAGFGWGGYFGQRKCDVRQRRNQRCEQSEWCWSYRSVSGVIGLRHDETGT